MKLWVNLKQKKKKHGGERGETPNSAKGCTAPDVSQPAGSGVVGGLPSGI